MDEKKKIIDKIIYDFIDTINNDKIQEISLFALEGGKRIRPIIMLELFENTLNNSCKKELILFLELLHNASLILDDLPCMDNDKMRRGKSTIHHKYGVSAAYLVSNYFIETAMSLVLKTAKSIDNRHYKNIIKVVLEQNRLTTQGQYIDLNNLISNVPIKDTTKKVEMLNLKTFPFFYLAFIVPFLISTTIHYDSSKLREIAYSFSICFQICDDFEDEQNDNKTTSLNSHIKLLGKQDAFILFTENIQKFEILLKEINAYTKVFIEIRNKLLKKINNCIK